MLYSKRMSNYDLQKPISINGSVNFLFLHCYSDLHLTLKLVFGMNFRRFLPISHSKQNTKANVTLINVFLQAKI